ncbi:MAG: phosphopyruvate hydratase [Caldisericia bacterium]|nr:phosphopyruvate hydratase [Caldisericia bacterium]
MDLIEEIKSREIIDSRGFPTVEAEVILSSGISARASVPSGASTGKREALELRDIKSKRFHGKGVQTAVENVTKIIEPELIGYSVLNQQLIDSIMLELDGTENKEKLGANAILSVSLAVARAASKYLRIPLYKYLGGIRCNTIPVPMMNIINGGKHADNTIDIQEFMIVPHGFNSFRTGLRAGCETYYTLKKLLKEKNLSTGIGDEGGFAPNIKSNAEALDILVEAIEKAGYKPSEEISISLDCAADSYYSNNMYNLNGENPMNSENLVRYYENILKKYPIYSIEDPFEEDDEDGWKLFTKEFSNKTRIIGDDVFVTNLKIFKERAQKNIANGILIKVNQIGSLTETLSTVRYAENHNYGYVISHRSGETEDTFIADLAVALGGGLIKTGAPCRSERTAKYNQLLRIEENLGDDAVYGGTWLK